MFNKLAKNVQDERKNEDQDARKEDLPITSQKEKPPADAMHKESSPFNLTLAQVINTAKNNEISSDLSSLKDDQKQAANDFINAQKVRYYNFIYLY